MAYGKGLPFNRTGTGSSTLVFIYDKIKTSCTEGNFEKLIPKKYNYKTYDKSRLKFNIQ